MDRPRRLPSLTSLRWFAALTVFVCHASGYFLRGTGLGTHLGGLGHVGEPAVAFFFVLSGFVLAWSHEPGDAARAFYRRRFARIAPTYWAVTLASIGLTVVLLGGAVTARRLAVDAASLTALQSWVPDTRIFLGGNPVDWTLSVEVGLYALFPLLVGPVLRTARVRLALLSLAAACVAPWALAFGPADWGWRVLPPARLPDFVLGVCLCGLLRQGRVLRLRPPAAAGLTVASLYGATVVGLEYAPLLTLAPLAALIYASAQADATGARAGILRSAALVRLGQWSFAFYLVHAVVLRGMQATAHRFGLLPGDRRLGLRLGLCAVALGLAVALAAAVHALVERPLERRLRGGAGTATPDDEPRLALALEAAA